MPATVVVFCRCGLWSDAWHPPTRDGVLRRCLSWVYSSHRPEAGFQQGLAELKPLELWLQRSPVPCGT